MHRTKSGNLLQTNYYWSSAYINDSIDAVWS
jgi:hypothetical protein